LEKEGKLVIAIPAEKGWTLYVNGEERPLETFKDALMAVTLEPGDYDIELKFTTPGARVGLALSAVCIALWLLCFRKEQK
ncbi:MAG: YfhO family protein, partial [Lachnospiraceae bacterium]|nr:YfhO family protein [Lachnospiraceae bacterium]